MARRRQFGNTWWGGAWVDALEQRARLDPNRLPRGRTYARKERVARLTVAPGFVEAEVQGSRPQPYVVTVRVRPLAVAEWDRVLDAVAARAAHAAALLDGELPAEVLADAQGAGVDLLPQAGEVQPRCTCPDWADPCKHAAAVCYLVADELDRDPFELLHLRGRTRAEVLAGLRERRRTGASPDATRRAPEEPGAVRAREAYTRPEPDAALLLSLGATRPPASAGRPSPLALSTPPEHRGADQSYLDEEALGALATDAAERAWHLLRGDSGSGLHLSPDADLVRRAAALDGAGLADLAARVHRRPAELGREARAWQLGGEEAWEVTVRSWSPAREPELAGRIHDARRALAASGRDDGRVTAVGNRVSRGDVQLRLAPSGRWWRFGKVAGAWEVTAGPAADPVDLL